MRSELLESTSNHSILSTEARSRAQTLASSKLQNRSIRRQTIHGALEGILGESIADDWSVDGESSFCSRQSAPAAPTGRYGRRCSITKFSLDPSMMMTGVVPTSVETKQSQSTSDDEISLCSQLSEDNSQRSSNSRRRYARRGSVTKYSLEPAMAAAADADACSVHSNTSRSSFPDIPAQCSTIDSLPIPMKTTRRKSTKKTRDSISKYSKDSIKEEILAESLHKRDDKMKKRSSKLEKKTSTKALLATCPDSPDSAAAKTAKKKIKKKKELKLHKDKPVIVDEADASVASEASSKRRQKRRCSVTKYNLPQELENQMGTSFSGPIPVEDEPIKEDAPQQEQEPVSPTGSHQKRHVPRRTSVTAYTPGIMDAAAKSPGALSKRPSVKTAEKTGGARRRNSITKYSLEEVKPNKTLPAAA